MQQEQRELAIQLLSSGGDKSAIAEATGLTRGQVAAIAAHLTMGTYQKGPTPRNDQEGILERAHSTEDPGIEGGASRSLSKPETASTAESAQRRAFSEVRSPKASVKPISGSQVGFALGVEEPTGEIIRWNPFPESGAANPHFLIVGESGFGKTYTIKGVLCEVARSGLTTLVLDFGQGFTPSPASDFFDQVANVVNIDAGSHGISINPLQIFSTDVHGPVNVAQRVADTFGRVYQRLGIQQHALLRETILEVFQAAGIFVEHSATWKRPVPPFAHVHNRLKLIAASIGDTRRQHAASVAAHISTMFVFNTFRETGTKLDWNQMLSNGGKTINVQLRGLESSLEQAITEFVLWNFISFIESRGPSHLQVFIVLDEAHRLSLAAGSPVEKLLREGRKFGVGLILASQQPEDFSSVAYSNTATKAIFQVLDQRLKVAKGLAKKLTPSVSAERLSQMISTLPRGTAFVISENIGKIVRLYSFAERETGWRDSRSVDRTIPKEEH